MNKRKRYLIMIILLPFFFLSGCNDEDDNIVAGDLAQLRVERTNPADGSIVGNENVDPYIEFDQRMDLSTTTVNTIDNACTGTIQLSGDNFSSCIQMVRQPRGDAEGTKVYLDPQKDNMMEGITYKFKVVSGPSGAKSLNENYLAEDYISQYGFTLQSGPQIVLFREGATTMGTIASGTRISIDGLCAGSPNQPSGFSNYRGFISLSGDEIYNFPTNYSVPDATVIKSPTGQIIANNWSDLLDGNIQQSLSAAGVLQNPGDHWWSGSYMDGYASTENCSNWTDSGSMYGTYGVADQTSSSWIEYSPTDLCSSNKFLLCIAY